MPSPSECPGLDLLALADIKRLVNAATLPADEPLGAEIDAFWNAAKRPAFSALHSQAFKAGYSQRGPVELNLGDFVGTILADPDAYPTPPTVTGPAREGPVSGRTA
jgi:hypothetical protein